MCNQPEKQPTARTHHNPSPKAEVADEDEEEAVEFGEDHAATAGAGAEEGSRVGNHNTTPPPD